MMNPERFLGQDPTPGDLVTVDDGAAALRETVLVLAEGRGRLDATVVDSPWRGPRASTVVDAVTDLRGRLDALEAAVVDFSAAWQEWRHGLARRQDRTAELVETMTQLAGDDDRRRVVHTQVDALAQEHESGARALTAAAEQLAAAAGVDDEPDVATGLRQALDGLDLAVRSWVDAHGRDIDRAGASVASVSALTAVVPHLLGVDAEAEEDAARALASNAPGSHRLLDALDQPPVPVGADALPTASFAAPSGPSLSERLRGPLTPAPETDDASGAGQ